MQQVLGPVSWLDCIVFVLCLIPQLLLSPRIGLFRVISWLFTALPFFLFRLPLALIKDHIILTADQKPEFVKSSTVFQELILRLVRFAFSNLPSEIGREFFGKWVALPFYRFRLLRNGYWPSQVPSWKPEEIQRDGVRGIWLKTVSNSDADIVLYYIHGGGFTMGSPYFYLEFLVSWASKLKDNGFNNPCIFAIDYTLVPELTFPNQLHEAYKGYRLLHKLAETAEFVISGDSAGGNIALSLLLHLARPYDTQYYGVAEALKRPSYATLISPWTVLVSPKNQNTADDFLDATQLEAYGILYANSSDLHNPYKSPGLCEDPSWLQEALPVNGIHIVYGNQEVFAKEIEALISRIEKVVDASDKLRVTEKATIHAWPVVQAFLGTSVEEREEGIQLMASTIADAVLSGNCN